MQKHSHMEAPPEFLEQIMAQQFEFVDSNDLPLNIQNGNWPNNFFERPVKSGSLC